MRLIPSEMLAACRIQAQEISYSTRLSRSNVGRDYHYDLVINRALYIKPVNKDSGDVL
ncbi:hypothetical protein SAMN05421882_106210 [Nitrosomonas communis]|uniref:Uncharacterized protein n=1 Tax=Nitrosomonas communis TaxID=44574 RepID=A0A1H2Z0A1_9PROT|nr:hypothetical protein SAMN05421882_106210 [Nitrosomonas communis]